MQKYLIILLILTTSAFAQYIGDEGEQCIDNCIARCIPGCEYSSDPATCGYDCGYNCAQNCGYNPQGGIGITNPDPCKDVTTADGYPTVYVGGTCADPYAAEHYCARAATCNQCQNMDAYNCIWNGACVPCKSGSCSFSCGGGDGWQDNTNQQITVDDNGNIIYPGNQACLSYATCDECTKAAQDIQSPAGCKWFPDSGTCIDMAGGIDNPQDCTYRGDTTVNPYDMKTTSIPGDAGATSCFSFAVLLVVMVGAYKARID